MECQLRIYRVEPGETGGSSSVRMENLRPLRERHGFEGYAAAEEAYHAGPDGRAVNRDPGPLVEATGLQLLRPVRP